MKFNLLTATALSAVLMVSSCKKDENHDDLKGSGPITFEFESRAGSAPLAFGTNYVTANGDTVNFSTFKYYLSNFVLVKSDGTEYVVPQDSCYHLVDHSVEASKSLTLNNIPAGEYTGIKYMIGVDSLRNTMDVSKRTGDLDPAGVGADMYWSWNSGYIFYKIEGTSPQSTETGNIFMFHVGGYGGYSSPMPNNTRTVALTSVEPAEVGEGHAPEVHIYADALEAFKTPTTYSIASGAVVHMPMQGTTFANNYADMFILDHVHNDH
jgi:hypothetical protein